MRSKGVTILSVIMVIGGIIGLYKALNSTSSSIYEIFIQFAFSGLSILFGVSLFLLKVWARKATIILYIISAFFVILYNLISSYILFSGKIDSASKVCTTSVAFVKSFMGIIYFLSVAWYLTMIFFLTRPKVKEQFKKEEVI